MSSRAKFLWDTRSKKRLDELERIHAEVRGSGRGRRWYTRELNLSLFLALVAQFQSYCKNLHDQAVDVYVGQADPRMADVLENLLNRDRHLDRKNPNRSTLGSDFDRLGFRFTPALKSSGHKVAEDLEKLDTLIEFRNAVSHGNDSQVRALEAKGKIKANLKSYRQFRGAVNRLVVKMDKVVSEQIAARLGIPQPW